MRGTFVIAVLAENAECSGKTAFQVFSFLELVFKDWRFRELHLDLGRGGRGFLTVGGAFAGGSRGGGVRCGGRHVDPELIDWIGSVDSCWMRVVKLVVMVDKKERMGRRPR